MKRIFMAFLIVLIPCVVFAQEITVAVAANVQFTLEDLKSIFQKQTGIKLKTIIGSSGKLTAQIQNGAPFDIFMSADMDYPLALYKEGLTLSEPKVYAHGALVLWSFKDLDLSDGLVVLKNSRVEKIAVANPKIAPYGRQAINVFKFYRIYPDVDKKLIYGESIAQVNQFINTQAADAGITAKSVVLSENMKGKGTWVDVDPVSYEPIAQGVVILKHASGENLALAQKFFDFLFSDEAKVIFQKYGYKVE